MESWAPGFLPNVIVCLTQDHGAIIVGSQAERYAQGLGPDTDRDWDLFVPLANWHAASKCIPMTARPNGRRGWRFEMNLKKFDVWPDDLARFLSEATSPNRVRAKPGLPAFAVDLIEGIVFQADRRDK